LALNRTSIRYRWSSLRCGSIILPLMAFTAHRQQAFTGKAPFPNTPPITVAVDVLSGNRPERPTHPSFTDDLWDLTKSCWAHDPGQRPGISEIVVRLRTTPAPQPDRGAALDGTTLGSVRQSSGELSSILPDRMMLSEAGRFVLPIAPADGRVLPTSAVLEARQDLPICYRKRSGPRRRVGRG